jgi:hypothetical protein
LFSAILDGSFLEPLPSPSARKETSHVNVFYLESIGFCTSKQFVIFETQAVHKIIIHKSTEVTTFSEATDWLYGLRRVQIHST